jgi:predicted ArsR family transcriptional regulator
MRGAVDVLAELRAARQPLRIVEIAERLGVHPNTVRFHLTGLIERGQVERADVAPTGPGRPAQHFRIVPRMDPRGPRHYRLLAEILLDDLVEAPGGPARAAAAGRAWGARLSAETAGPDDEPVDKVVDLMADLGFAPERDALDPQRIGLRHCPFLELAEARPQVVCGAHLGLLQGVLDGWQAPITADRLEPFVEPDRCLVHLAPRAG